MRRITRRGFGGTLLAGVAATMAPKAAHAATPDFSIIVIPDTQYETSFCATAATDRSNWIKNNRSASMGTNDQGYNLTLNTKMVVGVGDCTQNGASGEFTTMQTAYAILDSNGIPWVNPLGNHDFATDARSGQGVGYTNPNGYFSANQRSLNSAVSISGGGRTTFIDSFDQANYCTAFQYGTKLILFFALEYHPRLAVLTWGRGVADLYPGYENIISTHSFQCDVGTLGTFSSETGNTASSNDNSNAGLTSAGLTVSDANQMTGYGMWNGYSGATAASLLKNWPNLTLIVSGHFIYATATSNSWFHTRAALTSTSTRGQTVQSLFGNWQDIEAGNYHSDIPGGGAQLCTPDGGACPNYCSNRANLRIAQVMLLQFRPSVGLLDVYALSTTTGLWETTYANRANAPGGTPQRLYQVAYTGVNRGVFPMPGPL